MSVKRTIIDPLLAGREAQLLRAGLSLPHLLWGFDVGELPTP